MQKEFYVFRHGQTDMNAIRRWQGQGIDLPLNEVGREQARELAECLRPAGIEIIFSSPLKRAVQTAGIVSERLNVPVRVEPELIEGCFGAAEGKTPQEIDRLYPQTAAAWHSLEEEFMDVCFEGGETKRQIQNRTVAALKKIAAENEQTIFGISVHSAVIRCFALLFGLKLYTVPHGQPFHITFDQDRFELCE